MFSKRIEKSIKIIMVLSFMFVFLVSCSKKSVESIIKENGYKISVDETFEFVVISSKEGVLNAGLTDEEVWTSFTSNSDLNGIYHPDDQFYEFYPDELCNYSVKEQKVTKGKCSQKDIDTANELKELHAKFAKGLGITNEELKGLIKDKLDE